MVSINPLYCVDSLGAGPELQPTHGAAAARRPPGVVDGMSRQSWKRTEDLGSSPTSRRGNELLLLPVASLRGLLGAELTCRRTPKEAWRAIRDSACSFLPGLLNSTGPSHLKAGFLPLSSRTCTFRMRLRLVRTLAMSYSRRTLAEDTHTAGLVGSSYKVAPRSTGFSYFCTGCGSTSPDSPR